MPKDQLQRQKDQLLLAESALKAATHYVALHQKGTPKEDITASLARIKQIQVQIAELQKDLLKDKIISPIDGTIIRCAVKNGQYLQPGSELFTVGDLNQLKIVADVHESNVWKIQPGQKALIHGSVIGNNTIQAKVTQISPVADTKITSNQVEKTIVQVTLEPLDQVGILKPGYNVDIRITIDEAPQALQIPVEAVLYEKDGSRYVWKVENHRARKQMIETALENDSVIEIKKGLKKNEQVVINPSVGIQEDVRVEVME